MPSPLTAVVLCVSALTASATCMAAEVKQETRPAAVATAKPIPVAATTTAAAVPRQGTELIKSAAASTRDDAPPVARDATAHKDGQEQPRRGGTAMLLAALALMSGIALRRFGAPGR